MESRLIDSVVLDTIQAAAADLVLSGGRIAVTGMATQIPLRAVIYPNGYVYSAYSAGVAKTIVVTFTNALITDNQIYRLEVRKVPPVLQGLIGDSSLDAGIETFQINSATTATGTTVATAFAAFINARQAEGGSYFTATSSTNTLTIIAANALADFTVRDMQTITTTIAVGTAYVAPAGTYAMVSAVNSSATVGSTYDTNTYTFRYPIDGYYIGFDGVPVRNVQVTIYTKIGATNKAAFDTRLGIINSGAYATDFATTQKYLGVV